jgi:hypothetical protein
MSDAGDPQPEHAELEEIPVNDLIRITREFTRRITNQDRQRLGLDLRESGHSRSLSITAPVTLQQFFSGEIDLDSDLARRFLNAPLLSYCRLVTGPGESSQRQVTGIFTSNDAAAIMTVDAHTHRGQEASLEVTFTMYSALALRFRLSALVATDRRRWLDLMHRANGIAFLWTRERWEQPYLVFVVREHFARLYAFSPQGFEAAVRLTPDMVNALIDWLQGMWFPGHELPRGSAELEPPPVEDRSALAERPSWAEKARRSATPDAPEEQWEEGLSPESLAHPALEEEALPPELPARPDLDESDLSSSDLDW